MDYSVQSSKVIEDSSWKAAAAAYYADSYIEHTIEYSDDPRDRKKGRDMPSRPK
jgi:hypothetical protein